MNNYFDVLIYLNFSSEWVFHSLFYLWFNEFWNVLVSILKMLVEQMYCTFFAALFRACVCVSQWPKRALEDFVFTLHWVLIHCIYISEPAQKRRKSSGSVRGLLEDTKLFGSELIVYDKHNRCLLTDGDYELVLQEVQANVKGSPKKLSSWETIGEIKEVSIFSPHKCVKLKSCTCIW